MNPRTDFSHTKKKRAGNVRPRPQGPLHVRRDEEPDVSYVNVTDFGPTGCAYCGHTDHTHRQCPVRESVGAVVWG